MSIVHNWKVHNVIRSYDPDGTIFKVRFDLTSYDESDIHNTVNTSGTIRLESPDMNADFVEFEDVREENVIEWIRVQSLNYNVPNSDPVETKTEYEICHERQLKNITESDTYDPVWSGSDYSDLVVDEPEEPSEDPEILEQVVAEMGIDPEELPY
jgi:hypothetical protein